MLDPCRRAGSCTLVHAAAITALVAGIAVPRSFAAETHTTQRVMTVSVDVRKTCSISANDINFGNYNPNAGGAQLAEALVHIHCSNGVSYEVSMDAGRGPGATTAARKMTSGANTLGYGLYHDPGRQQVWGDTLGVDTLRGLGLGPPFDVTVYGKIEPRQSVPAGTYADVITVRILF